MIPWEQLGEADMPGGGRLKLRRRGHEFSIALDRIELMNSRLSGSEEALANLSAARIANVRKPKVLIGGLGMGFTLRAALTAFGPGAELRVAELVPAMVEWARGPMASLFGDCLDDPRVHLQIGDVGPLIASSPNSFDAILLDVDNGPDALTRDENDNIYSDAGLYYAKTALRPGGVLAVWSAYPDAKFMRRMHQSGLTTEEVKVRASTTGKGARHVIWFGKKR